MIPFLLKSTLLMALLLAVYQLFLGHVKMHRFSRYYLMAALLFSLAAPFITFETRQTVIPTLSTVVANQPADVVADAMPAMPTATPAAIAGASEDFGWQKLLFTIYLTISGALLIRFALNFTRILRSARMGEQKPHAEATLVLVDEPTPPFSFLRFIFVSASDFRLGHIGPELLTHELTHVRQHHTIDVLLVELLQVVLWFNPLVYLYKRAIRTNHEFLADERVIEHHQNAKHYQHLLLDTIFRKNTPSLVSNINFSLTKKRLTMMTKKTSKFKRVVLGSLTLVAISFAAFSFCVVSKESVAPKKDVVSKKCDVKKTSHYMCGNGRKTYLLLKEKKDSIYFFDVKSMKIEGIATILEGLQVVKIVNNKGFHNPQSLLGTNSNKITEEDFECIKTSILEMTESNVPDQKLFDKWSKANDVSLWIDNKHMEDNSILKSYKSSDFKRSRYIKFAQIPDNGPNKGKLYKVQMLTNAGYENYLALNKAAFDIIKNTRDLQGIKFYILD